MKLRSLARFPLAALLLISAYVFADEGMWTFDNLPKDQLKAKYGFTPDATWVDHVMKSSAALPGCSGSFISTEGLVLTNHHCIKSCLLQLSTAKKNYVTDGVLARKREEEMQCPAMEISRLEQITNVTQDVNAATKGLSGEGYKKALNTIEAKLASDCVGDKKATVRCSVITLYQGGQYHLYRYHRFSDVRMVWAPEDAAPNFGGDPDNFNFPRYGLDSAMIRVYENGKPAVVKDFFPFSKDALKAGELVFTSGNPGRTNRLLTVTQLEAFRDVRLIAQIKRGYEMRGMLTQYAKLGVEQERFSHNDLFYLENSLKVWSGEINALQSPEWMQKKRADEEALRKFVNSHAEWKASTAGAWDAIAKAQAVYRDIVTEYNVEEGAQAFNSRYFTMARTLLRGAAERSKPDGERLFEFTGTRMPVVERMLFSPAPISPEYEKAKLEFSLTKMREWLGTDDPFVVQVLGKDSPAQLAARLVDGTTLGDVAIRKALWTDAAALEKSNDPFIQLARSVDAASRAVRKRFENEISAVEQKNAELISKARFAFHGSKVYPDATGTLRLSYGDVQGWMERGKAVAPFTDFAGAFTRNTGADPYALPASWLASKSKLNLAEHYDFVTTNDIIGGNSGSPMINRNAEIVGLAFDGNIHSHGGGFWFDVKMNRTVGVTSSAIVETLKNIYGADELLKELGR